MIRKTHRAVRNLSLALAALLSFAMAIPCTAASRSVAAPATGAMQQSPEKIQELDEIWVNGKRLVDRINDAQDKFFSLYNKANMNDDYDIKCGYARLNPESMIMSRTCLPGFLGKEYGAPPMNTGPCYGEFRTSAGFGSNFTSPSNELTSGPCIDGGYTPPTPAFLSMAKSADLQKQLAKVIGNDSQLLQMSAQLGDLYVQLASVQQRFRKAKGIEVKARMIPRIVKDKRSTN